MSEDFSTKTCVQCKKLSEPRDEGLMLVGRNEEWQEWEPVMHPDYGFILLYPKDRERQPHPECRATEADIDALQERPFMDWLCNICFFETKWAEENMVSQAEFDAEFGEWEED